jgi:hypothetical protein
MVSWKQALSAREEREAAAYDAIDRKRQAALDAYALAQERRAERDRESEAGRREAAEASYQSNQAKLRVLWDRLVRREGAGERKDG